MISLENSEVSWPLIFSLSVSTCMGLVATVRSPFSYSVPCVFTCVHPDLAF